MVAKKSGGACFAVDGDAGFGGVRRCAAVSPKYAWFERLLRFSSLTSHPLPEHLYGDRLKRVDERTLSRRRGPIAQFSVAKK
jgi:hypothetical protein